MNKVYILMKGEPYEGSEVLKVFGTREAAIDEFKEELICSSMGTGNPEEDAIKGEKAFKNGETYFKSKRSFVYSIEEHEVH